MSKGEAGADLALQSASQGRVDMVWDEDGEVVFDDSEEFRVTTLLVSHLGEYWADETGRRGSRLHEVKRDTKVTGDQLKAFAEAALQKAADEGYIKDVRVSVARALGGRYRLTVFWKTPSGAAIGPRRFDLTT